MLSSLFGSGGNKEDDGQKKSDQVQQKSEEQQKATEEYVDASKQRPLEGYEHSRKKSQDKMDEISEKEGAYQEKTRELGEAKSTGEPGPKGETGLSGKIPGASCDTTAKVKDKIASAAGFDGRDDETQKAKQ